MDIQAVVSLISSVGFPIIACVYLFKLFQDLQKTLSDLNVSLSIMNERIGDLEKSVARKDENDNE